MTDRVEPGREATRPNHTVALDPFPTAGESPREEEGATVMKGRITSYDPETYRGEIQGHDGEHYDFARQDWHERCEPKQETRVDFEPSNYNAKAIYLDDATTVVIEHFPGPYAINDWVYSKILSCAGTLVLLILFGSMINDLRTDVALNHLDIIAAHAIGSAVCLGCLIGAATMFFTSLPPVVLTESGLTYRSWIFTQHRVTWNSDLLTDNDLLIHEIPWRPGGFSEKDMKQIIVRWCALALSRSQPPANSPAETPSFNDTAFTVADTSQETI